MEQEEKQLLLKDLCARLPYGVIVNCNGENELLFAIAERGFLEVNDVFLLDDCKPYLRPISSMTDEEHAYYNSQLITPGITILEENLEKYLNWMYSHNFDFRGLIEKNLALEAPEGMYKTE